MLFNHWIKSKMSCAKGVSFIRQSGDWYTKATYKNSAQNGATPYSTIKML